MSSVKNNIVVPIDFSEQSLIALNQSYNLARHSNADITMVYVIDEAVFTSMLHIFSDKDKHEELLREGISSKLKTLCSGAKAKSGLDINFRIEKGKIYEQVTSVAEKLNASFIVMGTSGESTLKKKFIGSNSVRVISEAHCPVITIKGKDHNLGCKTIVLPLDLSKETKEKTNECVEIAKFFNSQVKVVSIVNSEDEFLVNRLNRQMDQVVEFISSNDINCTGEFIKDHDISESIIDYSVQVNADLIIIMTQQEEVWTEYFIGTESQKIINGSNIPVCSIRPIERKDTSDSILS